MMLRNEPCRQRVDEDIAPYKCIAICAAFVGVVFLREPKCAKIRLKK